MSEFEKLKDEEVLVLVRKGNKQALDYLMEKYKKKVLNKARAMYLIGGDQDDLIQEGMIGLFKAAMDYDGTKNASFATFASLCIDRQMYTAVEAANRLKHKPLNSYISIFEEGLERDGEETGGEVWISDEATNPEVVFFAKENEKIILSNLAKILSAFEYEVLEMFLDGKDYNEIAVCLNKTPKSIDNALQRIKNKIIKMNNITV